MAYYENINEISAPIQSEENRIVNKGLTRLPEPYISGLKLNADVSLGSLQLNTIDENENVWVVTDIDGWWNLPEPDMPDLPRGWGDGSYDAVGRYAARVLTLNGSILVQDPSKTEAARQTLVDAISLVYEGAWLVVKETPAKAAFVRLSGRPQIASVSARGRIDFSVGLKAANPIKYEWVDDDSDPTNNTTNAYNALEIKTQEVSATVIGAVGNGNSVTYTTENNHGLSMGDRVKVSGVNPPELDTYLIIEDIIGASGDGTFVTYTTENNHGLSMGDRVKVSGINPSELNISTYAEVTSVTSNTFTVEKTDTDSYVDGGEVQNVGFLRILSVTNNTFTVEKSGIEINTLSATVIGASGDGTFVTYTTNAPHNFLENYKVKVSGINPSELNISTYAEVTSVTSNTFTVEKTDTDSYVDGGEVQAKLLGEVKSEPGLAVARNNGNIKVPVLIEIDGNISASLGEEILITNTTRSELIQVVDSIDSDETLVVDTYNREALAVTSNTVSNARSRLSTLVSWIHLDPGDNTIEFAVRGDLSGNYTCRILYRSGWIG